MLKYERLLRFTMAWDCHLLATGKAAQAMFKKRSR